MCRSLLRPPSPGGENCWADAEVTFWNSDPDDRSGPNPHDHQLLPPRRVPRAHPLPPHLPRRYVETWQGISYDELARIGTSRQAWEWRRYPLVERREARADCLRVKVEKWHPPHEITLVIRPSDGGYIVLYDEEERAILQAPDTELWIEGDGDGPERFTIGTLADRLGINRLPPGQIAGQHVPLHLS